MDFLKDAVDAFSERLRSPFLGYITLSVLFFNWQPFWYVAFAEKPVRARFLYFDANSTVYTLYFLPVILGTVIAVVLPWVKLCGALIAAAPTRRLKKLQSAEAMQHRITMTGLKAKEEEAIAELENATELRRIRAAERLARAKAVSDEAVEEIESERSNAMVPGNPVFAIDEELGDLELNLLSGLERSPQGSGVLVYSRNDRGLIDFKPENIIAFEFDGDKESGVNKPTTDTIMVKGIFKRQLRLTRAVESLEAASLILEISDEDGVDYRKFRITHEGFVRTDKLRDKPAA
jgi:hypothetical protein